MFFFDLEGILHNSDHKNENECTLGNANIDQKITASLSREPQTFRTMDRWSRTNKSQIKGLPA